MKRIILSMLAVSALVFTSCSNDVDPQELTVTAPETYSFERNGESTVSFSGQSTRIAMAEELISALKETSNTEAQLLAMFAHEEGNSDFSEADLNTSNKSIRSKTAASSDYFSSNTIEGNAIKEKFDALISAQVTEVFPNWDIDAVSGTAGKIQESGGGSTRYVNAKGLEYNQAINKGLIGALMVDQMLNNYLSVSVLDVGTNVDDNDSATVVEGKTYTTMEHKWDEAYGYLYGAEVDPASPVTGADNFLNKYLNRVEGDSDFAGIAQEIFDAFKLGRAAIVAKDYTLRNEQAAIIRAAVSKVIAIRAVYYLQAGKNNLGTDYASAFHDLSEGYGFVQSLRFTRNTQGESYVSSTDVEAMLATLQAGNGFWDITGDQLNTMSSSIANAFGFTVEEAAN